MQLTDYRTSHLERGDDYDDRIDEDEFSRFMAAKEREILLGLVPRLFGGQGLSRYLDFACGTGRITQIIEPIADESFGIDVSEKMVNVARKKCHATTFLVRDITRSELSIPPVNLITAFRFLGNAQDELRLAALKAIHRLLAPEGYLVVNNHRNPCSLQNLLQRCMGEGSCMDLSYPKLRRLFSRSGFRIQRTYSIGSWVLRRRWERHKFFNSRAAQRLEMISKLPFLSAISPDMVVVARKTTP